MDSSFKGVLGSDASVVDCLMFSCIHASKEQMEYLTERPSLINSGPFPVNLNFTKYACEIDKNFAASFVFNN